MPPRRRMRKKPITYDQVHVDVGAVREVNRLRFSGNVIFYNYDFNDDKTTTGDPIDEHYRNENLVQEIGRADYALSPALAVFVAVQHNDRLYTNPPLPGDVNRDSSGNEGDVGVDFELTQLVRAQVQVGYLDQSYQDQRIGDTSGFGTRGERRILPDPASDPKGQRVENRGRHGRDRGGERLPDARGGRVRLRALAQPDHHRTGLSTPAMIIKASTGPMITGRPTSAPTICSPGALGSVSPIRISIEPPAALVAVRASRITSCCSAWSRSTNLSYLHAS